MSMGYEKDIFGSFAYDFELSQKTYIRLIIYATFILLFGNKNIPAGDYHVRCGNGTVNGIRFVNFAFVCYLNIFSPLG